MNPIQQHLIRSRRQFLNTTASGLGLAGLGSMLTQDGLLSAASAADSDVVNPLAPRQPHHDARAKACIFIFMAGAPSHLDLFDPKPILKERHGQPLPKTMLEKVRFAFISKDKALLQGSPFKFHPRG
ncbi:MAG TPA: sulfatase, partial [Planctomycetaceae bacterium]|nr:sulfatase [Planctomycetaceae bacterium]